MPKIRLSIGGRPYDIACNDGEENHIKALAEKINARVMKISKILPLASESMLLVVTSLMMEDEINTLHNSLANKAPAPSGLQLNEDEINQRISRCVAEALQPFTEKLEALANNLETL